MAEKPLGEEFMALSITCSSCGKQFWFEQSDFCNDQEKKFITCPKCQKKNYISIYEGQYLGGHSLYPEKLNIILTLTPHSLNIHNSGYGSVSSFTTIEIPYANVINIENMTKDKMAAERVILLGIIGALWKKEHLYMVLKYNDNALNKEERMVFEMNELAKAQGELVSHVAQYKKNEAAYSDLLKVEDQDVPPLQMLKMRLAKGELTIEQYEQMKKVLES